MPKARENAALGKRGNCERQYRNKDAIDLFPLALAKLYISNKESIVRDNT